MNRQLFIWISAFRLRTLPLALSTIGLGAFLAWFDGEQNWIVVALAMLTTLFLQVLANLANDYGDSEHGIDNHLRQGPQRAVQSGMVTPASMKTAIVICSLLAVGTGLPLVIIALYGEPITTKLLFYLIGLLAVISAIKYTMGKNPYGYYGFGDLFVFVFFGLAGVMGTYFLITKQFEPMVLLPSAAVGFLSVAVLNLNNIRDHDNDAINGKITLVVRIDVRAAKIYHLVLVSFAVFFGVIHMLLNYHSPIQMFFLVSVPFFWMNVYGVFQHTIPSELDPYLKRLTMATLLFSLTFGIGLVL